MGFGIRGITPGLGTIEPDLEFIEGERREKVDVEAGFLTVPCVSIKNGGVVFVEEGEYRFARTKKGKKISPESFIAELEDHPVICIADIDGISADSQQLDALFKIRDEVENELWYDGGLRRSEEVADALLKGADRVIMGTKTIDDIRQFKLAYANYDAVIPSIDLRASIVSRTRDISDMSVEAMIDHLAGIGFDTIIVNDLMSSPGPFMVNDFIKVLPRRKQRILLSSAFMEAEATVLAGIGYRGMLAGARHLFGGPVR